MLAVLEPGERRRGRIGRWLDFFADGIGHLVAAVLILGAAVYPVVLAVQSGSWLLIVLAVVIIGGGALAMLLASAG